MRYRIDPEVLDDVVAGTLHHPLETGMRFEALRTDLAAAYPEIIDALPRPWIMSKAGGILGKISFLYVGPWEYLLIFGAPAGTNGYTGRYNHMDCYKLVLAGTYNTFDLESDQIEASTYGPGELVHMPRGTARGLELRAGSWHLEYGRGLTISAAPFAMLDTLILSMALRPALSTGLEYLGFAGRAAQRRIQLRR